MKFQDWTNLARSWVRRLEDREAARCGVPVPAVRGAVARRLGVSPGTLETLRSGRRKGVDMTIFDRLRTAVEADIRAEINALEHELAVARAADPDRRVAAVDAAETALLAARAALTEASS